MYAYAYDQVYQENILGKKAFYCLKEEIAREFERHSAVAEKLNSAEKRNKYKRFTGGTADPEEYLTALQFLSECLKNDCGTGAVILIDEYDVPLENAFFNDFYSEIVSLIRSLFESALKTNAALEFAVVTGCLPLEAPSPLGSEIPRQVDEAGFPTKLDNTSLRSQC